MRHLLLVMTAAALAACAGGPGLDGFGGRAANYAAASPLGAGLPPEDQRAIAPVFVQALSRGAAGERYDWRGPESFGWVKAGPRRLGGVTPDPDDRPAYPEGLYLDAELETELGVHALTANANVREGPSTDYRVLDTLRSGDGVNVVGRVVGAPWMLAEKDGRIVGYIHENLMRKAPGMELQLAGGPTRRPTPCREYEQRISYGGRSDRWTGVACRENGDWVLQAAPQNMPTVLY